MDASPDHKPATGAASSSEKGQEDGLAAAAEGARELGAVASFRRWIIVLPHTVARWHLASPDYPHERGRSWSSTGDLTKTRGRNPWAQGLTAEVQDWPVSRSGVRGCI